MAAESNLGFHRYQAMGSSFERHLVPLPSTVISNAPQMIPLAGCVGLSTVSMVEMMLPLNSNVGSHNSSPVSSLLLDSMPGLKHDAGFASEWSPDEQYKLEEGLLKYQDETRILRYIKIAATLPDKTVRDVALRSRWMTRKRMKGDDGKIGKRMGHRKVGNYHFKQSDPIGGPSRKGDNKPKFHLEGVNAPTKHLLEQNYEAFNQISSNLTSYKVKENLGLFNHTRKNIEAILDQLQEMPGVMSRMPPLDVCVDEELAGFLFPKPVKAGMMSCIEEMFEMKKEAR